MEPPSGRGQGVTVVIDSFGNEGALEYLATFGDEENPIKKISDLTPDQYADVIAGVADFKATPADALG